MRRFLIGRNEAQFGTGIRRPRERATAFFAQQMLAGKEVSAENADSLLMNIGLGFITAPAILARAKERAEKNREKVQRLVRDNAPKMSEANRRGCKGSRDQAERLRGRVGGWMFKIPFSNSNSELKLNSNFLCLSWYFVVKICYNISTLSRNVLMKKQNVLYPKAVKAIKTMGENLRLARRRRKITAGMMAERANMSLMTLRSIERGSPHVSMCNYMAVIACLGFQEDVAAVAANDVLGRDLQDAEL